jgi:hypothetical protein
MDIVSKINGNTCSATEFNQIPTELEALQTSSGQTSSDAILNQVSIGTSRYAANNFYIDSGVADAYVLTLAASMTNPVSATIGYFVGMTIKFRAGNANSGASTVNVNSAGVKNLKQADGTTDLDAGDISTTQDSVFRYNGTSFVLESGSASTTAKGIIEIATDAEVTAGTDTTRAIVPSALAFKQLNVAKITHQLASGTAGGGSTALAWSTRPLNTIAVNPNSIVTLSSNQFTLQAGTYKISAFQCLIYGGTSNAFSATSRIRNITDSTTPTGGVGVNCGIFEGTAAAAILLNIHPFILTIATSKTFELQYYTPVTQATFGLGETASSGEVETYASVYIEKI